MHGRSAHQRATQFRCARTDPEPAGNSTRPARTGQTSPVETPVPQILFPWERNSLRRRMYRMHARRCVSRRACGPVRPPTRLDTTAPRSSVVSSSGSSASPPETGRPACRHRDHPDRQVHTWRSGPDQTEARSKWLRQPPGPPVVVDRGGRTPVELSMLQAGCRTPATQVLWWRRAGEGEPRMPRVSRPAHQVPDA